MPEITLAKLLTALRSLVDPSTYLLVVVEQQFVYKPVKLFFTTKMEREVKAIYRSFPLIVESYFGKQAAK